MPRKNLQNPLKKTQYMFDGEEELLHDSFTFFFGKISHMKRRAKARISRFVYVVLASLVLGFLPVYLFFTSGLSIIRSGSGSGSGFEAGSSYGLSSSVSNGSVSGSSSGFEAGSSYGLSSSVSNGSLFCDRASIRSDICMMKGDIRADSSSHSVTLYNSHAMDETVKIKHEKIRPYTRKWETDLMKTIGELDLIVKPSSGIDRNCDVHHDVPAIVFSTGGFTGNLYHEFNDGIIPLYITSQHMNKKVVFVILEYHDWWMAKYGDVVSQLSDYPIINFDNDQKVHCFPETIIGLRIHDELTIDPSLMVNKKTMLDFHELLGQAYMPRIRGLIEEEKLKTEQYYSSKPKLVIISRNGSRAITNQDALVTMAIDIGFKVEVLTPKRSTELAKIYYMLNSSDVVIGVHGAAMTHLIFMKPSSVLIQVIPLGTDWAADAYYGKPARTFGLKYIPYKILPKESSLYRKYHKNDPVLVDPASVNSKGWEFTKRIYLSHQNVRLNPQRFRKHLVRAYDYSQGIKDEAGSHLVV